MKRPAVLALLVGAIVASIPPEVPAQASPGAPFELEELTIAELQERQESGKLTARAMVEAYLSRIESIDRQGLDLHSVIELNPDVREIADRLDDERKNGRVRGPLHGIPILIKDNIATADHMTTTAGSLALEGSKPPKNAFIVARLREAGAVILGKTNLSEWANFRSRHSVSGWSARGGQTKNPYALDRNPSGSSSGSAVAVAANLCAAAVGTETDGSIVSPASNNALVGIKPTLGLLSRAGIVPIAHSQDTPGPIARTVADAAIVLSAMVGRDQDDSATVDSERKGLRDYTRFLDASGLKGARIGVVRNRLFGYSAAADAIANRAIADMKRQGADIIDPAPLSTLGKFDDAELEVLLYEFKTDLNKYLGWLGPAAPVHSLKDIIEFNEAHRESELQYFGQDLMVSAQKKGPLTSSAYAAALQKARRMARAEGIDAVMRRYRLDALVAPTGGPAWLTDFVNGDGGTAAAASPSSVAAVAGYPHITVPAGYFRRLPIGISFIGQAWSEPTLIKLAYAYEQATRHRRPPTFSASAILQ